MLKRELKINLKTLIIFLSIIIVMLVLVFIVYPSIIDSNVNIDSMMKMFPKKMLETFNMDIISIKSVFGWLASEGYTFITLLSGCYFAILGGTIILKEQSDHTIDYLYSKPISKYEILTTKLLTGMIYLIVFNILLGLTTFIGLHANNDFNYMKWVLTTIAPCLIDLFFFVSSLFISLFFKKTSKGISFGIGVVFIMYILNILGMLTEKLSFLKYLSIFNYMNSRQIINNSNLETLNLIVTLSSSLIFIILSYIIYNKKELGL